MTNPSARYAQVAGCLLLALATIVGAFATHVLKAQLTADHYAALQTAVLYQFINALGLLVLGVLALQRPSRGLTIAMSVLFAGIVLFSGSVYLLLAGASHLLGPLTPLGGIALMVGWLLAAVALWRGKGARDQ